MCSATAAGYLPLPDGWEDESELVSVEYPIGNLPVSLLTATIYGAGRPGVADRRRAAGRCFGALHIYGSSCG